MGANFFILTEWQEDFLNKLKKKYGVNKSDLMRIALTRLIDDDIQEMLLLKNKDIEEYQRMKTELLSDFKRCVK